MSLTIKQQSEELQAASAQRLPAEVGETFARDREALVARGAPDAVAAGDVLEDFTLPDAAGGEVSLSELVADGPRGARLLSRWLVPLLQPRAASLPVRARRRSWPATARRWSRSPHRSPTSR